MLCCCGCGLSRNYKGVPTGALSVCLLLSQHAFGRWHLVDIRRPVAFGRAFFIFPSDSNTALFPPLYRYETLRLTFLSCSLISLQRCLCRKNTQLRKSTTLLFSAISGHKDYSRRSSGQGNRRSPGHYHCVFISLTAEIKNMPPLISSAAKRLYEI